MQMSEQVLNWFSYIQFLETTYARHVGLLSTSFCVFDVIYTITLSAHFVGRSTLAVYSRIFHSCIFHSRIFSAPVNNHHISHIAKFTGEHWSSTPKVGKQPLTLLPSSEFRRPLSFPPSPAIPQILVRPLPPFLPFFSLPCFPFPFFLRKGPITGAPEELLNSPGGPGGARLRNVCFCFSNSKFCLWWAIIVLIKFFTKWRIYFTYVSKRNYTALSSKRIRGAEMGR